ncbi:hypothetical protein ACMXYN_12955 [Neptuniibacter sp. PT8_73]|uniref:hypothetical protein n=1 Tax=unclassified Neptuniibacter TaxID=2630693 RepID=UPI0039F64F6F
MIKYAPLILLLFLQGCEFVPTKSPMPEPEVTEKPICRINETRLDQLQGIESRFLQKPDQRSSIMQRAIRSKDSALLALLLSTPLSSTEQLQQAKRNFSKIVLYPHPSCPGDRYLDIRNQFATALLWMRAEQDNLLEENRNLQVKIDALTQIETDLNNEREVQE